MLRICILFFNLCQASDKGALEEQLELYKDKTERLENDAYSKDQRMHELTLEFQSNLGEKMRECAEMKQALDFTTGDLKETKNRLATAETDLAGFQRKYPQLQRENDERKHEIDKLRDQG